MPVWRARCGDFINSKRDLRYEDEELVKLLDFKNIKERYYSGTYKYVIGTVNLQKLIDNLDNINADKAFIAFADQLSGVTLASV